MTTVGKPLLGEKLACWHSFSIVWDS